MGGRGPAERRRKENPEAAAAELAAHYARILGRQADRQVADVVRVCLRNLPSRLPAHGEDLRAVEVLIERVLRLGEVGARDPFGSPRQIDDYIARQLGLPACGPRFVYRALRAMLGRTALVERHSRQIWSLRLAGLTDASSALHRALLAETPTPYSLPVPDTDQVVGPAEPQRRPTPIDAGQADHLRLELAQVRETLAAERSARLAAEEQRSAAAVELGKASRALDEVNDACGEANQQVRVTRARVAELEQEIGTLRKAFKEEQGARTKAMLVNASQRYELEHEYLPIRQALDDERRARGEADRRSQIATAQLIELKEKYVAELREHGAQLQSMRVEMVNVARDAQVADAIRLWELIKADRSQDALVFIARRKQGLDVETSGGPVAMPDADGPGTTEPRRDQSPGHAAAETPSPGVTPTPPATTGAPSMPRRAEPSGSPARMSGSPAGLAPAKVPFVDPDQNQRGAHEKASKIGRNEPCPCGSGNKFKRCCGRLG